MYYGIYLLLQGNLTLLQRDRDITKVQTQKHGDTMVILVSQQNTAV